MTSKEEQADSLGDCRFLYADCDGFESNESDAIAYGDSVQLWIAPKEGKAATLLADQLFSPALLLAEAIEREVISVAGKTIVELGAGTALPSLLAATGKGDGPPTLVTITDYPDPLLMENLTRNVCNNFIEKTEKLGIEWQVGANDGSWAGKRKVGRWSLEDLSARKANVNWWIGKWASKS
ncbi:hypothetical protein FRC01_011779 [Tulasnella sp. 417]|nr:hypothetical protein FRC01_011779 [Tulasnella sp. 417]